MSTIRKQVFCVCVFLLVSGCQTKNHNSAYVQMLQKLQFPLYNAFIRPGADNGSAVDVEVDVVMNSLGPVNELDMTWKMSFYLRQEWTDRRLMLEGVDSMVKLGEDSIEKIWQPDLFFSNSKDGVRHMLTVPNRLVYINASTGRVLSSQRLTMELNCEMDLIKFPHDDQLCKMDMESYSYTTADLVLKWSSKRDATSLQPTVYVPDFLILDIDTLSCSRSYAIGTYPCLQTTVKMRREIGYYIFQTYLPSILIVILSWASFWIDHEAVPARISVGLLTVLTITTQLSGSRGQLPRVPYVKAIDVWMSANLVFVFGAYMEYAVVAVLSRKYKKGELRKTRKAAEEEVEEPASETQISISTSDTPPTTTTFATTTNNHYSKSQHRPSKPHVTPGPRPSLFRRPSMPSFLSQAEESNDSGRKVDKRSRFLFPLAYAVFNLVYWIYYMT